MLFSLISNLYIYGNLRKITDPGEIVFANVCRWGMISQGAQPLFHLIAHSALGELCSPFKSFLFTLGLKGELKTDFKSFIVNIRPAERRKGMGYSQEQSFVLERAGRRPHALLLVPVTAPRALSRPSTLWTPTYPNLKLLGAHPQPQQRCYLPAPQKKKNK